MRVCVCVYTHTHSRTPSATARQAGTRKPYGVISWRAASSTTAVVERAKLSVGTIRGAGVGGLSPRRIPVVSA